MYIVELGVGRGGGRKKSPLGGDFFLQSQYLSLPPNPVYKNFYVRGTFSTLTCQCPTGPTDPPPPSLPPLLRRLHKIPMVAASATMARRGQSHAPILGPSTRGQPLDCLFTYICTLIF